MNEIISAALRENADGDIHIERLLSAVHTGVRRRRQRQLALGSAAGVVLVLASLAVVLSSRQPATIAGPAPTATFPRPPQVEHLPTAADSPSVLGSDPTLFHLDLSDLSGWKALSWASRRSQEMLSMTMQSGDEIQIEAAPERNQLDPSDGTTTAVTVGGKPGEAVAAHGSHVVRWQPMPGIWAQVDAPGEVETAIAVAQKVTLDRVYRCAVPFRLTRVTPARMTECATYYVADGNTGRWSASGGVWFTLTAGGPEYQVAVGAADPSIAANDTIEGRPVRVTQPTGGYPALQEIDYPYDDRTAYFWVFYGPLDEAVFRSLVAAFVPIPDEDPRTWPSRPFSS
jgi:hypothetical protein